MGDFMWCTVLSLSSHYLPRKSEAAVLVIIERKAIIVQSQRGVSIRMQDLFVPNSFIDFSVVLSKVFNAFDIAFSSYKLGSSLIWY